MATKKLTELNRINNDFVITPHDFGELDDHKMCFSYQQQKYYWNVTAEMLEDFKEYIRKIILEKIGIVSSQGQQLKIKEIDWINSYQIQKDDQKQVRDKIGLVKKQQTDLEAIKIVDPIQKKAFDSALKNPVSLIIGYAGTGKTYTALSIGSQLAKIAWKISKVAPTGKAARMIGGKTIHSWLEPILEIDQYENIKILGYRKETMQKKECLIIDESSMIDTELWMRIMKVWDDTLHREKKMIIIGDPGQLEPVGEGKPFIDLIANKTYPITKLEKIYRHDSTNDIILYSARTREGQKFVSPVNYKNVAFSSKEKAINSAVNNPHVQILCPKRKNLNGTDAINKLVQAKIHLNAPENKKLFTTLMFDVTTLKWINKDKIYQNEKIIIIKNMWEWDALNGTTGIVKGIKKANLYNHLTKKIRLRKCLEIYDEYTKKTFYLPFNMKTRKKLDLAYAITIHKAQGSEFENVYLFLTKDQASFVKLRSLYTAITRAKEKIYIVK